MYYSKVVYLDFQRCTEATLWGLWGQNAAVARPLFDALRQKPFSSLCVLCITSVLVISSQSSRDMQPLLGENEHCLSLRTSCSDAMDLQKITARSCHGLLQPTWVMMFAKDIMITQYRIYGGVDVSKSACRV